MTFRPSDDVLDEIANDQQVDSSLDQYYNNITQGDGEHFLQQTNEDTQVDDVNKEPSENIISPDFNVPTEEVKAPDLSQLLQNQGNMESSNGEDFSIDLSEIQSTNNEDNIQIENNGTDISGQSDQPVESSDTDVVIPGKLPDEERVKLVSGIDGSIHGNLDFLVNKEWYDTIGKYKKIHRIIFKWGIFIFASILGISAGIIFQTYAKEAESYEIVKEDTIKNKGLWMEDSTEIILNKLNLNKSEDENKKVDTIVSYGSAKITGRTFQSKSNLIKYEGLVLPQLASVDYEKEIISLDKFNLGETTRKDLENALNDLILDSSIYTKTNNLSSSVRWQGQTFQGGLIDGFSLSCLSSNRAFDVVCDKFIDIFYEYGKYFDLSRYASELFTLTKELKSQGKDITPICEMVPEYTRRSGVISSDFLNQVMGYCTGENEKYQIYYNKIVSFIEVENSLNNPELSDKVFDNPDLNAYKLLSAMQKLHNFLEMNQINEGFTDSYLKFVQALINKDRGNNKYLEGVYKDLLYVFNEDYLLKGLTNMQQGISAQKLGLLRGQIDKINNGDNLGNKSLLGMLKTPDIIKDAKNFTGIVIEEKTIDELFLPYRSMNDRLKVRRVDHIGDNKLRVQTEIYSEEINGKTDNESLKATVTLSRKDNLLYVDEIKIANQTAFSQVLNMYAKEQVTLYAMLMYIDEQVNFHYEVNPEDLEEKQSLCDELSEIEDAAIYVCNDSEISLYKGYVEYNFSIINGILESYTISDSEIESSIKAKLAEIMMNRDNTPTIIASIVNYEKEVTPDDNIEKKLEVIDQFRIHFKVVPNVYDVVGEDNIFMVEFSLGDFDLQARYNIDTHLMTRISYVACDKTLEIRNLTIEVSVDNEAQLTEILNNPRIFLTNANQAAFKKYQKMCDGDKK